MTSDTWENADPSTEPPDDPALRPDDAEDRLRPVWEDTADETDGDLGRRPMPKHAKVGQPRGWPGNDAMPAWLGPLCDATDALARLDARAVAAPDAIREGLIARMAYAEAAGWLAHTHAWVHPLDLALRDLDLTGTYAVAAAGGGARVLPHTFAAGGGSAANGRPSARDTDWVAPHFDALAAGDRAVADALALARLLRQIAGTPRDRFAGLTEAAATLGGFGIGPLDPVRFAQWRAALPPVTRTARQRPRREAAVDQRRLPPLLIAAHAADAWMASGICDAPTPLPAVLAAVCLLARTGAHAVFVPVWAAYPAVAFGDRDALPELRSDVADCLVGCGRAVPWPVTFLHLIAEGARAGLRDLDRLVAAAAQGRGLTAQADRRSRLSDALDAALRTPALTPKALAGKLHVVPQTATALLHAMRAAGLLREVTGRRSFRAFAV
jgi:hypothetical protein